jgi:hypothetical protein
MPNIRKLQLWTIGEGRIKTLNRPFYFLKGWVEEELPGSAKDLPEGTVRFTKTSPIKSCDGNIVTTASGSIYYLGEPSPMFTGEYGDDKNLIAGEYCNPWIKGDNWLIP